MRALRAVLTPLCMLLLTVSFALTGVCASLRLAVLDPDYYVNALPRIRYCEEMQDYINGELDHIGALYGFSDGALDDLVTTDEIKAYTATFVEAVFAYDGGDFHIEPYATARFAEFYSANTDHAYDAAVEFSEDCLSTAQACMTAACQDLLLDGLHGVTQNRYVSLLTRSLAPLLAIDAALLLLLLMSYLGQLRLGGVLCTGTLFLGASLVFVPTAVFAARNYIGRLNIAASPLQLQVTGMVRAALTGALTVFSVMLAVTLALLLLCIFLYARKGAKKRGRNRKKGLTDD